VLSNVGLVVTVGVGGMEVIKVDEGEGGSDVDVALAPIPIQRFVARQALIAPLAKYKDNEKSRTFRLRFIHFPCRF
jgi:hypothetical protein